MWNLQESLLDRMNEVVIQRIWLFQARDKWICSNLPKLCQGYCWLISFLHYIFTFRILETVYSRYIWQHMTFNVTASPTVLSLESLLWHRLVWKLSSITIRIEIQTLELWLSDIQLVNEPGDSKNSTDDCYRDKIYCTMQNWHPRIGGMKCAVQIWFWLMSKYRDVNARKLCHCECAVIEMLHSMSIIKNQYQWAVKCLVWWS